MSRRQLARPPGVSLAPGVDRRNSAPLALRVGYRALFMTLKSDTGDDELQVLHGLELTLAFRF